MRGFISDATREQIRAANDIVEVIGSYVPLKRAGANFVALCPFHKEKSPSFNVNPHRQIFHCFGCHKGGDVFAFVKEYENLTFIDAVRRLAERARIPLEFDSVPGQQQARHVKETLWQIHEQITQRWQSALANEAAGQIARDYLAKRGVSQEAIQLFRLGYAPDLWDDTVNWAKSKGYAPDIPKRYVDGVVFFFDSDNAGKAAAIRVLDSLLASGLAIRVAAMPAPHDPDSFIKEFGGTAFREVIEKAEGFFDFYLNRL